MPHRIAFVCDFFYPRLGGVENHIYSLAQLLIRHGHKVIVITHAYSCPIGVGPLRVERPTRRWPTRWTKRTGVRYMPGPLKVYYCPILPMVDEDSLPAFTASYPLMRHILIRE